jgi:uncharacterized protein YndB with AHSA1/START domain
MKKNLSKEAYYAKPKSDVWKALTDSKQLTQWLMQGEFRAKAGEKFRWSKLLGDEAPEGEFECRVQEVREEERLSFQLKHVRTGDTSIVTWSLRGDDVGTWLTIEQEFLTDEALKPHPNVVSMALYRQRSAEKVWAALLLALLTDHLGFEVYARKAA